VRDKEVVFQKWLMGDEYPNNAQGKRDAIEIIEHARQHYLGVKVREQGGVAFLMIHAAMLGKPDPFLSHPNHWVSFLGNLVIDDGIWYQYESGNIKFNCYSWGLTKNEQVGAFAVDVGEGAFEDYFWGVVTGKMG
jgi:hypothetical protein